MSKQKTFMVNDQNKVTFVDEFHFKMTSSVGFGTEYTYHIQEFRNHEYFSKIKKFLEETSNG